MALYFALSRSAGRVMLTKCQFAKACSLFTTLRCGRPECLPFPYLSYFLAIYRFRQYS